MRVYFSLIKTEVILSKGREDGLEAGDRRAPEQRAGVHSFCGLIPQDRNSKNTEGRRLGPAHIEDERPHISHSLSQEPSLNSIPFSHSVVSLQSHGLQHARLPCPSPMPGAFLNSCSLSQWCHPTVSTSVICFSSCLQSFPASGSFQMSHSLHQMAKVLDLQLQHQSFQWIFRTDFL